MKKIICVVKEKALYLSALVTTAASSVQCTLASSYDLFDETAAGTRAANLAEKFCKAYRTWAIPFIVVTVILFALTKDEKKKEAEKRALIVMLVVYVLTYLVDIFTTTLQGLGTTLTT